MKQIIHSDNAPKAIGTYSQAVKVGNTVYLSGQIPLDPKTMALVSDDFRAQTTQVMLNLKAVVEAAGGSLAQLVKLNVYLTDLSNFSTVNEVLAEFLQPPYPARAAVQICALPKNSQVEIEGVLVLG